jgi:hypothetical protein
LGLALPSLGLGVGQAWQCPRQSAIWCLDCSAEEAGQAPRGAWAVRSQEENPSTKCPKVVFFHCNSRFLKFINDDNNIYTLINFNKNTKNLK